MASGRRLNSILMRATIRSKKKQTQKRYYVRATAGWLSIFYIILFVFSFVRFFSYSLPVSLQQNRKIHLSVSKWGEQPRTLACLHLVITAASSALSTKYRINLHWQRRHPGDAFRSEINVQVACSNEVHRHPADVEKRSSNTVLMRPGGCMKWCFPYRHSLVSTHH